MLSTASNGTRLHVVLTRYFSFAQNFLSVFVVSGLYSYFYATCAPTNDWNRSINGTQLGFTTWVVFTSFTSEDAVMAVGIIYVALVDLQDSYYVDR